MKLASNQAVFDCEKKPGLWTSLGVGSVSVGATLILDDFTVEAFEVCNDNDVSLGVFANQDDAANAIFDRWEAKRRSNGHGLPEPAVAPQAAQRTNGAQGPQAGEATLAMDFLDDFFDKDKRHLVAIKKPVSKGAEPVIKARHFDATDRDGQQHFIVEYNAAGFDLYFSPNPINGTLHKKASKRDIAEARYLWIDLDPRKGEPLEAERKAILALLTTNLPQGVPPPNRIIDSGRGYWGRWKLATPQPVGSRQDIEAVERYGRGIEQAFGDRFADGCRNIDRIARLPGTINSKTGRIARVLHELGHDESYPIEMFPCESAAPRKTARKTNGRGPDGETLKVADAFKHLKPEHMAEGIDRPSIDFEAVKEGCGWLKHVHETGGKDEPEPLWYQALRCCVYLDDNKTLIHELSNQYVGYTREETEAKFEHARADSETQDLGWPTCEYIHGEKCEQCKTCPHLEEHLAKGSSPLHLGLLTPGANAGVTRADFCAYLPDHSYIFMPTGTFWAMAGVNAGPGRSVNKQVDREQPVHHLTWAPGHPQLITNQLVIDGGWIERNGVTTFNLYRPPTLKHGDPSKAGPWLELVHKVYPEEAGRLIPKLAHRVQRPQEKINHAVVMGGAPGIGKDTILEPVKRAVGSWNFRETSPQQILGRFNGFLQSVIMRISEVRDLGEFNRYQFYEHTKAYFAAPPDTLRVDEKNIPEHDVMNVTFAILTTNRLTDGIFLPPDDRRHDVMWSKLTKHDFTEDYWIKMWKWYDEGGDSHVAAYLATLDISTFNPKAPPPQTEAFWAIVDANRAPEEGELQDLLDKLGNPNVVTLDHAIMAAGNSDIGNWLRDRKNRRSIPHRFDAAGYAPVRNDTAKSGLWVIGGTRQTVYAKKDLPLRERFEAATALKREADEEAGTTVAAVAAEWGSDPEPAAVVATNLGAATVAQREATMASRVAAAASRKAERARLHLEVEREEQRRREAERENKPWPSSRGTTVEQPLSPVNGGTEKQ